MGWVTRDWDDKQWTSFGVGIAAGIALVVLGFSGLAEVGAVGAALMLRWAIWQIPPPGRSKAEGTPSNAGERMMQLFVAVLLVLFAVEIVAAPLR